jgi:hypothetical protein
MFHDIGRCHKWNEFGRRVNMTSNIDWASNPTVRIVMYMAIKNLNGGFNPSRGQKVADSTAEEKTLLERVSIGMTKFGFPNLSTKVPQSECSTRGR